ncbi:MAG: ATP-binding protein [Myxococcota bacterium]
MSSDFQSFFRLSLDAMVLADDEGTYVDANEAATALFGVPRDQLIGKNVRDFGGDCEATGRNWEAFLAHGSQRGEFRLLRPNGLVCDIEYSATVNVAPHRHLTVLRDVTAARTNERCKDELLAMLGHELRSPLAPIFTALEVMRHRCAADPSLERARAAVERQVRNMARLVDDLLDISRVTRGTIELRRTQVTLRAVVEQALQTVSSLCETRAHELAVRYAGEGLQLEADPARLEQVVTNLLVNAAKFTPPGGRIEVTVGREGEEAVLKVRDSGVGIRPEQLSQVFEMFVQLDPALDRAQGGLGLGLALVRKLVELHGGTVHAHSEGPGQGTELAVRLPLSRSPLASPPSAPSSTATEAEPLTILIAEDHPDAREFLRELLELWGHRVHAVADGRSAVEHALGRPPDVALVDIGLPELDGYEVVRRIRRAEGAGHRRTFLVALTGYGQPQDRAQALAAGFDEHRVKPLEVSELRELLAVKARRTPPPAESPALAMRH